MRLYRLEGRTAVPDETLSPADIRPEPIAEAWIGVPRAPGSVLVSTVFLVLDHDFSGEGPPRVFETMIFRDGKADDFQRRYATWDEAMAGHLEAVEAVKAERRTVQPDSRR